MLKIMPSAQQNLITADQRMSAEFWHPTGVTLGEQIKRNYDQLVAFNRAITQERREALENQSSEARERLEAIEDELKELNESRARSLAYLRESEALAKYKDLSREITVMRSDLIGLENRRQAAARLLELRREVRTLGEEHSHLVTTVEDQLESLSQDEASRFGRMRRYFTEIIFEALEQNAILAIKVNQAGGIDFSAEFIGDSGTATSMPTDFLFNNRFALPRRWHAGRIRPIARSGHSVP